MITFLRLAGLATAAIWLGGSVFYMLMLDPLLGRADFLRLLGPLHAGETWVLATERFFLFQIICATLALVHTMAEWLYSGRPLDRRVLLLLVALLALGGMGRLQIAPKCRTANLQAYMGPNRQILRQAVTPEQRRAERSLAIWHGVMIVTNLISLSGIALNFYRQASPPQPGPRIFPRNRLRI